MVTFAGIPAVGMPVAQTVRPLSGPLAIKEILPQVLGRYPGLAEQAAKFSAQPALRTVTLPVQFGAVCQLHARDYAQVEANYQQH